MTTRNEISARKRSDVLGVVAVHGGVVLALCEPTVRHNFLTSLWKVAVASLVP